MNPPSEIPRACRTLISRTFCPSISVAASQDAEDLCKSMGFKSTLDLIAPFGEQVSGRVTVRDSQGLSASYEDYSIRFRPPPGEPASSFDSKEKSSDAVDRVNEKSILRGDSPRPNRVASPIIPSTGSSTSVASHHNYQLYDPEDLEALARAGIEKMDGADLDKQKAKVYLDYVGAAVKEIPVTPFETFSHPVAGILATSSRNDQPIETLSNMYKQSYDPSIPDYINKDYLRYYVLVHDDKDDIEKSTAVFEKMKRYFGLHCHLLRVKRTTGENNEQQNGESPSPSLHEEDVNAIKLFVRELVTQSVMPFMERCVATWNDQVASSRRGITGRFFSASKKYFSSSSRGTGSILSNANSGSFPFSLPGTPASSQSPSPSPTPGGRGNYNTSNGSYSYLTPEAQIRKLADFAFMLRDYKFAYTTYEMLKKDFHNDKAWAYLASAQEMAVISHLMQPEVVPLTYKVRVDTIDPLLDSAVYTYNSRCGLHTYAFRCLLLSSELFCTVSSASGASDGATRWLLRLMDEKLCTGPVGYAMLLERVSGAYLVYDEVVKSRRANKDNNGGNKLSPAAMFDYSRRDPIVYGSKRTRKAAFWELLAAREWYNASQLAQAKYCLASARNRAYKDQEWTLDTTKLYGSLVELTNKTN